MNERLVVWTAIFPRFCSACKRYEFYKTCEEYTRCYGCLTYFDEDMQPLPDTLNNELERLRKRTRELIRTIDIRALAFVCAVIGVFLAGAVFEHYGWLVFLW